MSSKPKKAFDGIARPQGFIDDAAKTALRLIEKGADNIGRALIGMNRQVRKDLKSRPKNERQRVKDMYLGPKKGTYGNPYSAKTAPNMGKPIRSRNPRIK